MISICTTAHCPDVEVHNPKDQLGRLPTQPSWEGPRGDPARPCLALISPLGLSSPKGTAARSGTPNVSQHPVWGLRAGQDGGSEPGDGNMVPRDATPEGMRSTFLTSS